MKGPLPREVLFADGRGAATDTIKQKHLGSLLITMQPTNRELLITSVPFTFVVQDVPNCILGNVLELASGKATRISPVGENECFTANAGNNSIVELSEIIRCI